MKFNKILLAAAMILSGVSCHARVEKNYTCESRGSSINFTIDSIDFRSDLTRVYGRIQGQPHTANRIDNMAITLSSGVSRSWTDVEGVDMKRWFQYEDSGIIPLEIDFPAMKRFDRATVRLTGPKGESIWKISKAAKNQKTLTKNKRSKRKR